MSNSGLVLGHRERQISESSEKAGHSLLIIGVVSAPQADVVQEATLFMAACYGETNSTNDYCGSECVER